MVATDPRLMSPFMRATLLHDEMLAVHQVLGARSQAGAGPLKGPRVARARSALTAAPCCPPPSNPSTGISTRTRLPVREAARPGGRVVEMNEGRGKRDEPRSPVVVC